MAKLAIGQERYYLDGAGERVDAAAAIGGGVEDYYADPAEARGRWAGRAADRLGLGGDGDADGLRQLLNGVHPRSGGELRAGAPLRVAAFDLTFSAPKSVSVLFGVGGDEIQSAVREAHDAAVVEALGYLERSAAAVRRGRGGCVVEAVDGFVAAAFRHRASRAGDPQLHTHIVVANLGQGSDGRWTALDGRRIYAHATTASHVYQAVLRGRLTRALGLDWMPVANGIAEIEGVPRPVLNAFSRRRAEIEAALAERGTFGPRASEAAALATRRVKDRGIHEDGLRAEWRERAAELRWSPDDMARAAEAGERLPDLAGLIESLVGPDGLTASSSTFSRRDVVRAVCALTGGGAWDAVAIEALADRVLGSPGVVPIADAHLDAFRRRDGRVMRAAVEDRRYSTAELLTIEQRILDAAEHGRGAGRGVAQAAVTQSGTSPLSDEQRAMVQVLTHEGDAIAVVAGRAGTGKTFALATARETWESAGLPVAGAAVARRAARELERGAGIPSTSVSAMVDRFKQGGRLPDRTVLVVDEAGMIGTRDLAKLADHVEACAGKLVLVGDPGQLPSIAAGGAFRGLVQRGHAVTLHENRRQVEAWERVAVEHLREGRVRDALATYESHDRIHVEPDDVAARARLVRDWWTAPSGSSVMIAARRTDVRDLNAQARELMCATGQLGNDKVRVRDASFAVGDAVVVRRNDLRVGVANGDRATVTAVDERRHSIELDCGGKRIALDSRFLTRAARDGGASLVHGYAMTCHVAQGTTVDQAFVLADAGLGKEWGYTALTRGRHANHLYLAERGPAERDEYGPRGLEPTSDALGRLAEALARSETEPLALDHGRTVRSLSRNSRGIEL